MRSVKFKNRRKEFGFFCKMKMKQSALNVTTEGNVTLCINLAVRAHPAGLTIFSMGCGLRSLMFLTEFGDFYDLLEQDVSGNHISSVVVLSVAGLFSLRSSNLQHKTCTTRGTKSANWGQIESAQSLMSYDLSSLRPL